MHDTSKYLTTNEIAEKYGIDKNTFRAYYENRAHNGLFKISFKIRHKVFFDAKGFEKWFVDEYPLILKYKMTKQKV